MRRRIAGVLVILGLAVGLTGAAFSGRVGAQAPDVLVVGRGFEVLSLDPHKGGSDLNIFDTLVARDADWQHNPGLALSWQTLDPTTWELKLRRGVRFHNGEPFNAHVVKFSFERGLDPKTKWARAGLLRLIKAITIVDEYTVRFATQRPWPQFVPTMAMFGWVVPPRYLEKNGDDALLRRPVGTGPYRFVRWVKDDRLELEANDDYWGGRPKIRRVVVRTIPNNATRLAELLSGSVHLIELIPPELYGPIQRSPRTRLVQARSAGVLMILLNLNNIAPNRPLADRRVRLALNHAVDRRALIASIMHNVGAPVATFCTEVMRGCDMSIAPFPYDVERARTLLREAGYPDGFDMTISTTSGTYPGDRDLTLAVADQLSAVGVRARPVVTEFGVFLRALVERKLPSDAAFARYTDFLGYAGDIGFRAYHPQGYGSQWFPGNREFQQLLETAEVIFDEARLRDLLRRAQLLFRQEAPGMPLITAPYVYGLHRNLEWRPRPDLTLPLGTAYWRQ
ncbi:MAG: hypothetical protein HY660_09525 [Armatimonadetes bacterium]|nr:hypothetical protein [Armatimonadota bacterium]